MKPVEETPQKEIQIVYIYQSYNAKYARKWVNENREQWNAYSTKRKTDRYHTDPEYRKKIQDYQRNLYRIKAEKKKQLAASL